MRRFRFQISRVSGHLPGGLFQVAPTYFPAFAVSEDGDAKPLDSDAIKQGVSRRLRKVGWRNDPMSQAKWTSQARRELVDIADYIAVKSRRPEKPNHIIDEIEHSTRPKTPINMAFDKFTSAISAKIPCIDPPY